MAEKNYGLHLREWSLNPLMGGVIEEVLERLEGKRPVYYMVRIGRRGSKTTAFAEVGARALAANHRVLYLAPTALQSDHYWFEVTKAFSDMIDDKVIDIDKQRRILCWPKTEVMLSCKTAWNYETARGGGAELVQQDELQLQNEEVWERVTLPMMAETNGCVMFAYTPPSLMSKGTSKARDPRNASKMFKAALADTTGLWKTASGTSMDNGYLSKEGLETIAGQMNAEAYRQEILAIDDDVEKSWMVYASDFKDICRIKRFAIPKDWGVVSGHDFGAANPAALFAARVETLPEGAPAMLRRGDMIIFAEYSPKGGEYDKHIENFKRITRDMRVVKSVGGNLTTEKETRQLYTNAGWRIDEPGLDGRVGPQINMVKHLMGNNRIYIFDDLLYLWADICGMMFKVGSDGQPTNDVKDEKNYHRAAALRYMCSVREFNEGATLGEKRVIVGRNYW